MLSRWKTAVARRFPVWRRAIASSIRLVMLQEEFAKARNSKDQFMHPALKDKIEKLKYEFYQGLPSAPNYATLKYKLDMLKDILKAKNLSEKNNITGTLKQEINKRFNEVMDRSDVKEKIKALKAEIENSGLSRVEDLDQRLKEKIMQVKEEVELEFADVFKSLGLHMEPPSFSDVKPGFTRHQFDISVNDISSFVNHMEKNWSTVQSLEPVNKTLHEHIRSHELKELSSSPSDMILRAYLFLV
ncbi:hypothetical protein F0562_024644 [Nyssa sinensis]|uniref:Uncharacterized protein n=1 Tax=Nyssa sinensis TaxID=561372 RepID=A0A5J5BFF4_9ASTE|nr:hypothetical protein F0562_024644 [Nyssa sinensis]